MVRDMIVLLARSAPVFLAPAVELATSVAITYLFSVPWRARASYAADPMRFVGAIGLARAGPALIAASLGAALAEVLLLAGDPGRAGTALVVVASVIGGLVAPVVGVTGRPRMLVPRAFQDVPSWAGEVRAGRVTATRTLRNRVLWSAATVGFLALGVIGAVRVPGLPGLIAFPCGLWAATFWLVHHGQTGPEERAWALLGPAYTARMGFDPGAQPGPATPVEGADLLADLAAAGFAVSSPRDLRDTGLRYTAAVPALMRWLPRASAPSEKQAIAHALAVSWAAPALELLIGEFQHAAVIDEPDWQMAGWEIGDAISVVWDDRCFDALARLATDERYGHAREMVVVGLGRSARPEAGSILVSLLGDGEVAAQAVRALREHPVAEARDGLTRMLDDERGWVRRNARLALNALDKRAPAPPPEA